MQSFTLLCTLSGHFGKSEREREIHVVGTSMHTTTGKKFYDFFLHKDFHFSLPSLVLSLPLDLCTHSFTLARAHTCTHTQFTE